MKKLLILSLVLAMVGFANATLFDDIELEMRTPGVITIVGLRATNDYLAAGFGIYGEGFTGIASNGKKLPASGSLGAIIHFPGFESGYDMAPGWSGIEGQPMVEAGDWFQFDWNGGYTFDIMDYRFGLDPIGQITISEPITNPEPMTMSLLCLGFVFLRKRKH